MYKRQVINGLFIAAFPFYGIGAFVSASISPSAGYIVSVIPCVLILMFYLVDLLYLREFRVKLNGNYLLMLLFMLSSVASIFIALNKGLPETNFWMTVARSVLIVVPFHAFLAVILYNEGHEENLPGLLIWSLGALLFINLIGFYGLGLSNAQHSIEGRLNLPFLDGFYSGAGMLAILNLMILPVIRKSWGNGLLFLSLVAFFVVNLVLFYMINSRLALMIFVFLFFLWMFRLLALRGLYLVSLFTLPILMGSGVLLYKLVKLPGFSSLMQRVDLEDVLTFHGRSYLWQDALDWFFGNGKGLLLGNGYKGHYFLDLVPDVAKLWDVEESYHLHLHSTSLEILVCQGLLAFALFCIIFYGAYRFFRKKYKENKTEGAFLPAILFLLFVMQVDTFVYLDSLGFAILAFLVARVSVSLRTQPVLQRPAEPRQIIIDQPTIVIPV